MAFPAFEEDLPSIHADKFVNGERAIVTSDPSEDATVGTWYFSRFAQWEPGIYNLKIIVSGQTTMRVGVGVDDMKWSRTLTPGVLHITQIYIPPGLKRIDLAIEHPVENLGTLCGFAMTVFLADRLVYGSSGDGWVVDGSAYPSDEETPPAPHPDTLLPVFSILPNWRDGIVEQIQYLTDVIRSETGFEQARSLRAKPRRTMEAEFLRADNVRQRLDMFLVGLGRRYFMVPLWHEQFRPEGGLASGAVMVDFPSGTVALREFGEGDLVFVNDRDPTDYEILKVLEVADSLDRIVFEVGPTKDWPAGTRIVPLRKARIVEKSEIRHPTDTVGVSRLRFDLGDYEEWFSPNWGTNPPRFKFIADRSEDVNVGFDRVVYWQDNSVGEPYGIDPGGTSFVGVRASVLLRSREEIIRFRRFVGAARGRARRFFMPSLIYDLTPVAGIGGATLQVKSIGYTQYAERLQEARKAILVEFRDGTADMLVKVTGVTTDGETDTFTLEGGLPSISMDRVKRIQFALPSRFDQDTFEFLHYVDDAVAARVSVVTRTVREAVVTNELFVTTTVYPLEDVHGMDGDLLIEGGLLQEGIYVEESAEGDVEFESGTLREPIVETYPLDEAEGDLLLEEGTLRQILWTTTADDEVEGDLLLESGTLRAILVTIVMDIDSLDGDVLLEGGSLYEY